MKRVSKNSALKDRDKGEYLGYRDIHIKPDLVLVYKIHEKELILLLARFRQAL
ncbi:type II toxin-antitoxin system mRNA interferase toxin, RelE/StbE family [Helicobacter sp. 13S00401-1]|uniref:type II toxin-antitoxin system mRNA interferase toxin, RelE/StbE family n=1 Tax=Helicobacter sp. 13S00401-1 TaxID=1905758 RepID=UPI000BA5588F